MRIAPLAVFLAAATVQAADIEAGRALVQGVCAACHGATGVSVSESIPHLAGQRAAYLAAQLNALRDGRRKNPLMNPIAAQLTRAQIEDIAAYFAAQPGAAAGARSEFMPHVARTNVTLPPDRAGLVHYHTQNFPEERQVRRYYANAVAARAAREGRRLPDGSLLLIEVYAPKLGRDLEDMIGPDGTYVPGTLLQYRVMARGPGWGKDMPPILRNEDWNYAVFTSDRRLRQDVNHAECLACHRPQDKDSFLFTLRQLAAKRQATE